jgi:hypothetical protein
MKTRSHTGAALIATAVVFLGACPSLAGLAGVEGDVEFLYSDPYAGSVAVAGDFNGWSMDADPLEMDEEGVWRVVLDLEPGRYEYKFVVNGSQWMADPDNPKVVGDYGNSELVVGDDGMPTETAEAGTAEPVSNTALSSRVKLDGWYRATYNTVSNVPSDPRWRLERPAHEVYLAIKPTVNENVTGDVTLRLDTGVGDINKLFAEFYSGNVVLSGSAFGVLGYYNEERYQFDNPIEQLGHYNLDGTILQERIYYGRGSQGVGLDANIGPTSLVFVYANIYDWDIYNDPEIYDNTGTDLLAGRLKWPTDTVTLGATWTSLRDGWWINYLAEGNEMPELDEFVAETGSESDWFELAIAQQIGGVDVDWPAMQELLRVKAEIGYASYRARWDVGNKERIEGTDYTNGRINVPVGDTAGWVPKLILFSDPVPPLSLRLDVQHTGIDGMDEDEEWVSYETPVWGGDPRRNYTDVGSAGSSLVVGVWGPAPTRDDWETEFDAGVKFGIFDALLEYDWGKYNWEYYATFFDEEAPENTKLDWSGTRSRLALQSRVDLREADKLWFGLDTEYMGFSVDGGGVYDPLDTWEIILLGRWEFVTQWSLVGDLRWMTYYDIPREEEEEENGDGNSAARSDETYTDTFFAPFVGVVWDLRTNIKVLFSYGVNPTNYIDTPVEGHGNGRERWRSHYQWTHSLVGEVGAEKALEDAQTLGIMAVLTF